MSVLVGKLAPDFTATAVVNGDFKDNFKLRAAWSKHNLVAAIEKVSKSLEIFISLMTLDPMV
jgi:hypothetical protein